MTIQTNNFMGVEKVWKELTYEVQSYDQSEWQPSWYLTRKMHL